MARVYSAAVASINATQTPQTEPVPGKNMAPNNAGGFGFKLDKWGQLNRALMLGSAGGTYYVSEKELTISQSGAILDCLAEDGLRVVAEIVSVSTRGLAPKQSPQVWALALALSKGDAKTKRAAIEAVSKVCRTGSTFFELLSYLFGKSTDQSKKRVGGLRGKGQIAQQAVLAWYEQFNAPLLPFDSLGEGPSAAAAKFAYQAIKYRERNSWNHKDAMAIGRPKFVGPSKDVAAWAADGWPSVGIDPHPSSHLRQIWAFERAKAVASSPDDGYTNVSLRGIPVLSDLTVPAELIKTAKQQEIVQLIVENNLTREMIPTEFMKNPAVWEALLEKMPITAMVRNLANMTKCGLLAPHSDATRTVVARLSDVERLKKGRVHPINLLAALRAYSGPKNTRYSSFYEAPRTFSAVQDVVDALDNAFYLAFDAVVPSGKRHMVCVDVSASMSAPAPSLTNISCCEVASALGLVLKRTEPDSSIWRFNNQLDTFPISPRMRLDDVLKHTREINGGGTDCALPMQHALTARTPIDVFVVITDSETHSGRRGHPFQALRHYRDAMGIPAKLVVIAITGTDVSIADPSDAGMLDVAGFDLSVPSVLRSFAADESVALTDEEE